MFSFRKLAAASILFLFLFGLPALAQDGANPAAPPAIEFNISLTDYNFAVEGLDAGKPLALTAGQTYRLHFSNDSAMKMGHEVLFGKNANVVAGSSHLDYADSLLDDVEVLLSGTINGNDFVFVSSGMKELEVASGQALTIEFTLPDDKVGDWEIGCFEFLSTTNTDDNPGPTHYDVGMHIPVVVSAAAPA